VSLTPPAIAEGETSDRLSEAGGRIRAGEFNWQDAEIYLLMSYQCPEVQCCR
jgi:hypothetical protein